MSLVIAGKSFHSRLIVGSGKYESFEITREATLASGAEMITVAVRRVNILDKMHQISWTILRIPIFHFCQTLLVAPLQERR